MLRSTACRFDRCSITCEPCATPPARAMLQGPAQSSPLDILATVAASPAVPDEPPTPPCFCKPPEDQLSMWLEVRGGRFWCTRCSRYVVRVEQITSTKGCERLETHELSMLSTISCADRKMSANKKINHLAMRFQCPHLRHP